MGINLITLATVKTYLGLSDTTYDTAITAQLPVVSNDVRRILNTNFDKTYLASFDETGESIDFGILTSDEYQRQGVFMLGQIVTHPNIPDETYLSDYNPLTGIYTLSATPTDSGTYITPTLQISQLLTVSRMIWYRISNFTTGSASKRELSSERIGPLSKTYAESEINSKYNYPQRLINDLGARFLHV